MHSSLEPIEAPDSFDESLSAAQARLPGAMERFHEVHGRWVARTAVALCRRFGLPEQEDHEDTEQEAYRRLLDPRLARFNPRRGDGKKYVRGVILNAIPGRRRRRAYDGGFISESESDEQPERPDPEWQRPFDYAEARADLSKLLRHADGLISRAVKLRCVDGLSQREAATSIGVSEFKLCRALGKFLAMARLAARGAVKIKIGLPDPTLRRVVAASRARPPCRRTGRAPARQRGRALGASRATHDLTTLEHRRGDEQSERRVTFSCAQTLLVDGEAPTRSGSQNMPTTPGADGRRT